MVMVISGNRWQVGLICGLFETLSGGVSVGGWVGLLGPWAAQWHLVPGLLGNGGWWRPVGLIRGKEARGGVRLPSPLKAVYLNLWCIKHSTWPINGLL